jgi:hypothetical protein
MMSYNQLVVNKQSGALRVRMREVYQKKQKVSIIKL